MLVFVIEDQPHRTGTDLRRKLVACLLVHGSTFSGVGASGKPGAVHLVDAARHPTEGRLWAALRLQWAATAVSHAGHIEKCLPIVDQPARRREDLASGTGVH